MEQIQSAQIYPSLFSSSMVMITLPHLLLTFPNFSLEVDLHSLILDRLSEAMASCELSGTSSIEWQRLLIRCPALPDNIDNGTISNSVDEGKKIPESIGLLVGIPGSRPKFP